MITLRIIDTNQNNYFPQKVENLSFKNIHYGGNSELNFKLNEDPSFQNHKVNLFNNIYLYNFSTLVWSGYITEFQKDYKNLNYNLRASGLLTDFTNKRIKKTYVLDDIGDFKNWNEKDNKESDEILYGYSQAKEEKGVKISLLQRNYVAEEDGLFEIKIDENIERLKARMFINQPANFTTKLVTLDENHSNPTEEKKWANAQKIDENVILDIIKTEVDKEAYAFNFASDDGNWTLSDAIISGGVLDIIANYGYGQRSPDPIWLSGANDDFTIEINFKQDSTPTGVFSWTLTLRLFLIKDGTPIQFGIRGDTNVAYIAYGGVIKKSTAFTDDTAWHTARIRRVGTTYYFRIDAGAEISWNYGTKKEIQFFETRMEKCTGEFDTFKYYWQYASEEGQYQLNEKRYLQFRVECTDAANITTDKYFAQLENLKLLTSDNEINAANILKDLLINHTQKLDLDTSLIQDCYNFKDIELCESLTGWAVSDATKLTLSLEDTIVKEGSKSIKTIVAADSGGAKLVYSYPFTTDDGNWAFSNADISGGTLNITVAAGYGQRSPDANWLSGATDDFILETDGKLDATNTDIAILLYLVGDAKFIHFHNIGSTNLMRIVYDGTVRASQAWIEDTDWHTHKIRRVGTTYYYSIDGGAEISWNYGTARALNYIRLMAAGGGTGKHDNFKYSWTEGVIENLTKTIPIPINLQNKNLFRLWVRSTITGDILKAKFGENLKYQFEPEWSCQYEAGEEPDAAEPVWTLTGNDYGSVADGILTINKVAANECSYKRIDIGHNVKGNTILTRVKATNVAKTTIIQIQDGIAKVQIAIYSTKIEDWNDAANSYTIDMTKYRELWLTMKNNFWLLYVDGTFALCGETQTTVTKIFNFGMDSSANLGKSYWDYVYYYNLGFLRNKRIEKIINIASNIYEFDFASDDGKWTLSNATITGGVLNISFIGGYGERSPDADWDAGANDDFILEVDWKVDADEMALSDIVIYLTGNKIFNFQVWGSTQDIYRILYMGALKASGAFNPAVDTWYTARIRRVGTTFYFRPDSITAEISWNYGEARAIDRIQLKIWGTTGEFDNLKYYYKDAWQEQIIDLNNFPIATRDAIKYIQFEVLTNDAFTFYIDWIRSNFELTSAYYRDRTAPLNILEDVLAYQDYEWTITKDRKVKFFEVDRNEVDYICPIRNLTFEENSTSYFSKIYLVYFDAMMKRQEIELVDETSKIPFIREHIIGLGGISDVGAKAIGEAQFEFHKKPRYQLDCLVDNFVFDKNGGRINPVEIEPNKNIKFLGIPKLPIFRIIATDYSGEVCRLTLETYPETTPNIMKSIIGVL